MLEDGDKLNKIEDLNRRLYAKNQDVIKKRRIGVLHQVSHDVNSNFSEQKIEEMPKKQKILNNTSMFKKFFISSLVFFGVAILFALLMFFRGGNTVSNQNIEINILGNSFTAGGEDLPLQVEIVNKNSVALQYADLLITYPKNSASSAEDVVRVRQSVGDIPAGGSAHQDAKVVLFGEQGSTKTITATLEYRISGSNAVFVTDKTYDVSINSSPVALTVDSPSELVANQPITFKIKAILNTTRPADKMLMSVDYPPGFQFTSADPKPSYGNNVWTLGDLVQGLEKDVTVTGTMYASAKEQKSFHVYIGTEDTNDQTKIGIVYNSLLNTITMSEPFLDARLLINGQDKTEFTADNTRKISGEIRWANNLPTRITDAEIHLKFSGNAFTESGLDPRGGFYNSMTKEIVWDKNSVSQFAALEPGQSGSLTFLFNSSSLVSQGTTIDSPQIVLSVSVKGKEPTTGTDVKEITSSDQKVVKINSNFQLAAKGLYYSGAFQNTGSIPPKAENETTYTIVWDITNSANSVTDGEARATLPPYVTWKNKISPTTEDLSYNTSTNEVVWKIGSVSKGVGFSSAGREVSFQVSITPSTSQIGSIPMLVSNIALTGTDTYTTSTISDSYPSLNTSLLNDPNFPIGGDRVVQ